MKEKLIKEFDEITEIKNKVEKEIYIEYLEKVIKILLKNNHNLMGV